jgi:hypothetical protein
MWNSSQGLEEFAYKTKVLDEWCRKIGRDPKEIERTANVSTASPREIEQWLDSGLQHFVLRMAKPFDTKALARLMKASQA